MTLFALRWSSMSYKHVTTEDDRYVQLLREVGIKGFYSAKRELVLEIDSLNDILKIMKIIGHDIILSDRSGDMSELELEIYDDWRE